MSKGVRPQENADALAPPFRLRQGVLSPNGYEIVQTKCKTYAYLLSLWYLYKILSEIPNWAEGPDLLHDLQRRPLAVTRRGAGQQGADGLNRLAIAANDPPNIALPQLHPENRRLPAGQLVQHHLIGKLDELANDELEKLFHGTEGRQPR